MVIIVSKTTGKLRRYTKIKGKRILVSWIQEKCILCGKFLKKGLGPKKYCPPCFALHMEKYNKEYGREYFREYRKNPKYKEYRHLYYLKCKNGGV
jgi:hypothetical protein